MLNGFHGTDDGWERTEAPLRRLDPVFEEFAHSHNLILSKSDRNWPDRSLRWSKNPEYLIQAYLDNEKSLTFTFWVSSSDDRSREVYWKHETLAKNCSIEALEKQLPELMTAAYKIAQTWGLHYPN